VKEKSDLIGRLGSLFKRGHAHEDFPTTGVYEGPLSEINRQRDLEHPFEVEKYHDGFYDKLPKVEEIRHVEPVQIEEDSGQIFAHKVKGYPEFYQHEGPFDSTTRQFELSGEPLEHHVQVYAPGKYFESIKIKYKF
jgi:hypothetical protein